jgi:hypothetical protein
MSKKPEPASVSACHYKNLMCAAQYARSDFTWLQTDLFEATSLLKNTGFAADNSYSNMLMMRTRQRIASP